jgi:hypothetical protein
MLRRWTLFHVVGVLDHLTKTDESPTDRVRKDSRRGNVARVGTAILFVTLHFGKATLVIFASVVAKRETWHSNVFRISVARRRAQVSLKALVSAEPTLMQLCSSPPSLTPRESGLACSIKLRCEREIVLRRKDEIQLGPRGRERNRSDGKQNKHLCFGIDGRGGGGNVCHLTHIQISHRSLNSPTPRFCNNL